MIREERERERERGRCNDMIYVIRMFKVSRKLTYTRVLLVKAGLTTNGGYGMDKPGADSVSLYRRELFSHTLRCADVRILRFSTLHY